MKLYRVETQDGEGPYRGAPTSDFQCWEQIPCADGTHPTLKDEVEAEFVPPYRELVRRWGYYNLKYGFAFNDQLNRWFAEYFDKLAPFGYGVAEYTIHPRSVYVTPTQALFNGAASSLKRILWTPLNAIVIPV